MKNAKRILSILLSLCMVATLFSVVPMSASAASGATGNCKWALNGGNLVISGNGVMDDYSSPLDVPWYSYRNSINSITINEGVTRIGVYAFMECRNFTSVTIPSSVTAINNYAFEDCTGLTKVNVTDLTKWCNIDFENYYANPLNYAKNLYLNDKPITALAIPNGVKTIKTYAFYGCTSVKTVKFPKSVTAIGEDAFCYCAGLSAVTIPDNVTKIGDRAFYFCYGLKSVTVGNGVTAIGKYAFWDCYGLKNLTIGKGVTAIGDDAFYKCTALTSVNIPDSVTSIDKEAFARCEKLSKITLGKGVKKIGSYAFEGCSSLKSIEVGKGVEKIGNSAFGDCEKLTVKCYPGSYAEKYVKKNGVKYSLIHKHKYSKVAVKSTGKTVTKCKICGKILKTPKVKITAKKKAFSIKLTKVSGQTGYKVKYRLKGKKKWTTKTYKTNKSATKTVKKLKSKKKYQIAVCAYVTSGKKTVTSAWSKTITKKTK